MMPGSTSCCRSRAGSGYGGETQLPRPRAGNDDPGRLVCFASTKRISVIATIHTACNHQFVAKQIRHDRRHRAGPRRPRYRRGLEQARIRGARPHAADDHETRYAYAQEWFDIIQELWAKPGAFDITTEHFKL
jgi:hypothetical protein